MTELEGELMRIKEDLASEKQRADGMAAELQQKRRGAEELEQRVGWLNTAHVGDSPAVLIIGLDLDRGEL